MKTNNNKAPKSLYNIIGATANFLSESVLFLFDNTVLALAWMSKKIWKRYLHIETPLYKLWWKEHSKCMQRKIDRQHPEWQTSKTV